MGKLALVIGLVVLAQGCSTFSSRKMYMPDGSTGYAIECEGVTPCYEKAGELCGGKGYTVVGQSAEQRSAGKNVTIIKVQCK